MLPNIYSFFLLLLPVTVSAQCGPGAVYNEDTNKCFQFYKAAVDFDTAESVCATSNGHLASVHNAIDNNYLAQQAQKFIYSDGPVWLGAQSQSAIVKLPQNWRWLDSSSFDYQNYRSGQPSSFGTTACMQFLVGNSQWLTASCSNAYPFICAYEPTSTPEVSTCPPQKLERCPSRYTWFDETNFCYKNVVGFRNFTEANSACQYEGAELASIHSQAENDFLVELSKAGITTADVGWNNNVYIGLIYTNGNWKWTDGTTVDYLNWAAGEPNKMNIEFWTTLVADGHEGTIKETEQWNNVANIDERAFICKKATN